MIKANESRKYSNYWRFKFWRTPVKIITHRKFTVCRRKVKIIICLLKLRACAYRREVLLENESLRTAHRERKPRQCKKHSILKDVKQAMNMRAHDSVRSKYTRQVPEDLPLHPKPPPGSFLLYRYCRRGLSPDGDTAPTRLSLLPSLHFNCRSLGLDLHVYWWDKKMTVQKRAAINRLFTEICI